MAANRGVLDEVESFREKHFGETANDLPVDVLTLCEITLQLHVIRFPGLHPKYGIDAGILPDFSGIYVDQQAYDLWESGPVWKQNRLRFSVAHELGHFALHKNIAMTLNFDSLVHFQEWASSEKFTIEQEANEFAGRLLVPVDRLAGFYDDFGKGCEDAIPGWRGNSSMRSQFVAYAAPKFGVNKDVIGVRLDREGIWPVN